MKKSFLARVIEVPEQLSAFVTAFVMAGFVWLEAQALAYLGIDFGGLIAAVGTAVAAVLTFGVKALLEKYVPEQFHGLVNAVLLWLAGLVTLQLL